MPSSGYVADTFVAGEQPTTAKWNELWGNDASFNSGNGFNDAIIVARHLAANVVKSAALALSNALDSTGGVQSQANAGTAGGTMFYINLGGIKLLWCRSGTLSFSASGAPTFGFTFPASFFSTIQGSLLSLEGNTGSNNVEHFFANVTNTGSAVIELKENGGVSGTTVANILIIGT